MTSNVAAGVELGVIVDLNHGGKMSFGKMLKGGLVLIMALSAGNAMAYFSCFTFSNQVLFRANNPLEKVASGMVVQACEEHPATHSADCAENLRCFEQNDVTTSAPVPHEAFLPHRH